MKSESWKLLPITFLMFAVFCFKWTMQKLKCCLIFAMSIKQVQLRGLSIEVTENIYRVTKGIGSTK
jgi:hypothetical protein